MGKNAAEALTAGALGFETVRALIYAGLVHEDHSLRRMQREEGLYQTGQLLSEAPGETVTEQMSYLSRIIQEAMTAAFGGQEKNVLGGASPRESNPPNGALKVPSA